MGKIKDITNIRFGNLVAIKNTGKKDNGRNLIWLCQCDCGNQCEVSGNNLRTGHTKSCGCLRQVVCSEIGKKQQIIDEVGKTYGKLTVISFHSIKGHVAHWNCQCDCGHQCVVAGTHLRSGHTQSCGCLKSQGEMLIKNILQEQKIQFITEKTFADCKMKQPLKFDFYLPELNTIIEYNGQQHYEVSEYFGGQDKFEKQTESDTIKQAWCQLNDIKLIIIPYWDYDKISSDYILNLLK